MPKNLRQKSLNKVKIGSYKAKDNMVKNDKLATKLMNLRAGCF